VAGAAGTFPLVPRRRLIGLAFGGVRSARRGLGDDIAGSRPYYPGDDVDLIDWNASARLSSARGSDEFVVRQTFADEAPRVVVFCDRRPQMSIFSPPLPWLDKAAAMRAVCDLICDSAVSERGFVGYLDFGDGEPFWRSPKSERELWEVAERLESPTFAAAGDTLQAGLDHLAEHRVALPPGTFVFVVSDFLGADADAGFERALGFRWDVVPVVVQDPVWEQSFPDVGGLVVPYADPSSGRVSLVRLSAPEAHEQRRRHEERLAAVVDGFRSRDLEPVVVSSADRDEILEAVLEWSDARLYHRGRLW
jgi:uncharacterized protein (DUF58 family)